MRTDHGLLLTLALFGLTGCSATSTSEAEKKAAAPAKPPAASITQFYASPASVGKGGRSLLCYGVEAAASVRLDPPVEEITPSLARCIEVKPAATTTYKLTAVNRAGEEVSQSVTVTFDPKLAAAPKASAGMIQFFTAMQERVSKGATVTLCYGVKGAASVSLGPPVQALVPSERMCFQVRPEATTTYTLKATGADGSTDSLTIRVNVQ